MKVGMVAEATCISKLWTIIPRVVTQVQDYIAAGQFSGLEGVTPGSSCIANAYTSNHERIASKDTGTLKGLALHVVDATGLVHALLLRIQALLLPIKPLVRSGH